MRHENWHFDHPFPHTLEPFTNQHSEKNNAPWNLYSRTRRPTPPAWHRTAVALNGHVRKNPYGWQRRQTENSTQSQKPHAKREGRLWSLLLYMDGSLVKNLDSTARAPRVGGYHKLGNVPFMVGQAVVCDAKRLMMRAALVKRLSNAPCNQDCLSWCFPVIAGSVLRGRRRSI